jgi:hypothetical protein
MSEDEIAHCFAALDAAIAGGDTDACVLEHVTLLALTR